MREIKNSSEFDKICNSNNINAFIFYSSYSDKSKKALEIIKEIEQEKSDNNIQFYSINASEVKDIHPRFNIDMVPTLLIMKGSSVKDIFYGLQTKDSYLNMIYGNHNLVSVKSDRGNRYRIVVYTSDGCPWCKKAKDYLKEKGFAFKEINVSRNPSEAEKLVKRTGQMGTPQININGKFIIGFDKPKIDMMLGIKQ